jgi:hypothetical protein
MSQVARYGGFQTSGIGTVVTSLPVAVDATPATGDLIAVKIPAITSYISSVEAQVDTIASSAGSLRITVYRDAAGDEPLIGNGPSEATQTLTTGLTTATDGGCAWSVGTDVHALPAGAAGSATAGSVITRPGITDAVGPTHNDQTLYFSFKTNTGTCRISRLIVNWRA